jgi:hypothetical protein
MSIVALQTPAREGLNILEPTGYVGSTPTSGTNLLSEWYRLRARATVPKEVLWASRTIVAQLLLFN